MATVRSIGAGRVLLDFNPPLAGKTLIYDVTVQKKLKTNEEKIASLIHRRIPLAEEAKFKLTLTKKTLTVDMPEETYYLEGIQVAKRGIWMDVQKFFPNLDTVRFVEAFKAEPKPEAKPENP
jgi:peptidylprolyl isomerase